MRKLLGILSLVIALFSCNPDSDSWEEVQKEIAKMDSTTFYESIIAELGEPYKEFPTPSLPEEYVLYYNVPNEPDSMYWIMIDSETKTFLYWSNGKHAKKDGY